MGSGRTNQEIALYTAVESNFRIIGEVVGIYRKG